MKHDSRSYSMKSEERVYPGKFQKITIHSGYFIKVSNK